MPSAVRACVAAARARISPRPRRATSTGSDGHAEVQYFGYRDLGFPALRRQFWRVGRRHDRRGEDARETEVPGGVPEYDDA